MIARKNAQEGVEADLPAVDWHDDEFLAIHSSSPSARRTGSTRCAAGSRRFYEVLLGASQGPRFGGFIALYGIEETKALIAQGLAGELAG